MYWWDVNGVWLFYRFHIISLMKGVPDLYSIGDYISYGNSGVCEVMGTEFMESSIGDSDARQCYILRPLHDQSCKIMTPVDNQKVIMRDLISPEETKQLLDDIPQIETLPEQSARQQEISYSKALHSGSCREWLCLVKTLTQRIESRRQKGKKVTATDDRYFKAATEKLIEEFSIVLDLEADEAKDMLMEAFEA